MTLLIFVKLFTMSSSFREPFHPGVMRCVLTSESVDEILTIWCDHSNESYGAVLSCGSVYYVKHGWSVLTFESVGENLLFIQTKGEQLFC